MRLRTIEEQNEMVRRPKSYTGVECPTCKSELQFTTPGVYLMSSPPQADVKCFGCTYTGRIFV